MNTINLKIPALVPWQIWFHAAVNIFYSDYFITSRQIWIIYLHVDYNSMPGSLPPGKVQHSDSLLLCFSELHRSSGKPGTCTLRLYFTECEYLKCQLGSWPYWRYWKLCYWLIGARSFPIVYRITSEKLFLISCKKQKLSGPYSNPGLTWPCLDILNPNSLL